MVKNFDDEEAKILLADLDSSDDTEGNQRDSLFRENNFRDEMKSPSLKLSPSSTYGKRISSAHRVHIAPLSITNHDKTLKSNKSKHNGTQKGYVLLLFVIIIMLGSYLFLILPKKDPSSIQMNRFIEEKESKITLMLDNYIFEKYHNLHRHFFSAFNLNIFDDKLYEENYVIPQIRETSWFDLPLDKESRIFNDIERKSIPKANIKVQQDDRDHKLKAATSRTSNELDRFNVQKSVPIEEEGGKNDNMNNNMNYTLLENLQKEIEIAIKRKEKKTCHPGFPEHCCIGSYTVYGFPAWRGDQYACPKANFHTLPIKTKNEEVIRYLDMSDAINSFTENKTITFIGDSMSSQHAYSAECSWLRATQAPKTQNRTFHKFFDDGELPQDYKTIMYTEWKIEGYRGPSQGSAVDKNPIITTMQFFMQYKPNMNDIINQLQATDVYIMNFGLHYLPAHKAEFRNMLVELFGLSELQKFARNPEKVLMWRENSAQHHQMEGGEYSLGIYTEGYLTMEEKIQNEKIDLTKRETEMVFLNRAMINDLVNNQKGNVAGNYTVNLLYGLERFGRNTSRTDLSRRSKKGMDFATFPWLVEKESDEEKKKQEKSNNGECANIDFMNNVPVQWRDKLVMEILMQYDFEVRIVDTENKLEDDLEKELAILQQNEEEYRRKSKVERPVIYWIPFYRHSNSRVDLHPFNVGKNRWDCTHYCYTPHFFTPLSDATARGILHSQRYRELRQRL